MKQFLLKVTLFSFPIILVIVWTLRNYNDEQSDLGRMSYLSIDYDHSKLFKQAFVQSPPIIFNDSTIVHRKKKWKYFIIGDSFSQQKKASYIHQLTAKCPDNVVNFRPLYQQDGNIFTTIHSLLNSDYFDSLDIEYVVLENVERYIVYRGYNPDTTLHIDQKSILALKKEIDDKFSNASSTQKSQPYPTDRFVKFPLNNLVYSFKSDGINGQVLREPLTTPLFSTANQNILFFEEDIHLLSFTNNKEHI